MWLWNEDPKFIDGIFDTVYTRIAWYSLSFARAIKTSYTSKTLYASVLGSLAFSNTFRMSKKSYVSWVYIAHPIESHTMRIQEHVKLSAIAATIALPWLGKDVIIPLTSSILIDVDHYLWHAITFRTLSLRSAVKYFGQADPPQKKEARLLHHPLVLGTLLLIALLTRSRFLMLILAGLVFHVSLDVVHMTQMQSLKQSLSEEANNICPECGEGCKALQLHTLYYSPRILNRYDAENFVVLCPTCHEKAHSV